MNEHHELNREGWNIRTEAHFKHPDYHVKEFLKGRCSLHPLELEEMGDVTGKTLLHLQCHFGLDTLSWARRGATVTGIDISDKSIERANELKEKTGLEARFIRSDLFDLPDHLDDKFDIVYTSYGVLWWIADINHWAEIIARYVKQGGIFYIAEIHPLLTMFDQDMKVHEPYFNQGRDPEVYKGDGDYCDKDCIIEEERGWRWTLGDVVTALIKAGLTIEFLHEFPFCVYDAWPTMVKDGDWYYYPERKNELPMTFSLRAAKK